MCSIAGNQLIIILITQNMLQHDRSDSRQNRWQQNPKSKNQKHPKTEPPAPLPTPSLTICPETVSVNEPNNMCLSHRTHKPNTNPIQIQYRPGTLLKSMTNSSHPLPVLTTPPPTPLAPHLITNPFPIWNRKSQTRFKYETCHVAA